jgi:hypothetical protein
MEVFSGWAALLVVNASGAHRRSTPLVIGHLVNSDGHTIPLRGEPVEPRFEIPSWQEKTATVVSRKRRKTAFSQPVGDFLFAHRRAHAILVEKSENASTF